MVLRVLSTPMFTKVAKKLFARDKKTVDEAIRKVANDPSVGEEKKGDLSGIFVFKFKMNKQEVLLSYGLQPSKENPEEIVLLSSHENFYEALKRQI